MEVLHRPRLGICRDRHGAPGEVLVPRTISNRDALSGATMPRASAATCAMTCLDEIAFVRQ
jgi:hypothetical protein